MADKSGATDEWAVVVGELHDQGNPANGSDETHSSRGPSTKHAVSTPKPSGKPPIPATST
jgi:hypothetical protein